MFSPDGKHTAYTAVINGEDRIVLDGRVVPSRHDDVLGRISWHKGYITYWVADYPEHSYKVFFPRGTVLRCVKVRIRNSG